MSTVIVTAVLLVWVFATLPLAVAVGRAFDAGSHLTGPSEH